MKPYIKAACCVALLIALPLAARAQSSVELYGIVDTSIQWAHSGGQSTARLDASNVQTSSWGLRGEEDLGGGMKAIFKLENGFNTNNGAMAQTGKMFGREAWVGLSGKYGSITAGLHNTPLAYGLIRYSMGDLGHWDWGHASNNYDFFTSTRVSNSVAYTSPIIGGVTLSALYARGANGDSTLPSTLGDTVSVGLNYTRGPLSVEADYESMVYGKTSPITADSQTGVGNFEFLGASYDFNFVKLGALAMLHRGSGDVKAVNSTIYADPNNLYYDVSALFPHMFTQNGSLMVSFGQYRLQGNSDGNSSSIGTRYDYHLSPRTGVYTGVAYIKNGSLASFTQTGAAYSGIPVATGKDQIAVLAGMMHRF
jgi:predicted porin